MKVYAINASKTNTLGEAIELTEQYLKKVQSNSLVVFPEYHLAHSSVALSIEHSSIIKKFTELAKEYDVYLASGFTETDQLLKYTAAILVNPKGEIIGKQRKMNPASFEKEKEILPGSGDKLIDTPFGVVRFSLCKDQWYFKQRYDAEILLHLRGFGLKHPEFGDFAESWLLLDRATAMLNKAYVIGCTGAESEYPLADVIDFEGNVIAMSSLEGMIEADIDLKKLRKYRKREYTSKKVPRF